MCCMYNNTHITLLNFGVCNFVLCFWKKFLKLSKVAFNQKYIQNSNNIVNNYYNLK